MYTASCALDLITLDLISARALWIYVRMRKAYLYALNVCVCVCVCVCVMVLPLCLHRAMDGLLSTTLLIMEM